MQETVIVTKQITDRVAGLFFLGIKIDLDYRLLISAQARLVTAEITAPSCAGPHTVHDYQGGLAC